MPLQQVDMDQSGNADFLECYIAVLKFYLNHVTEFIEICECCL